MTDHKHEDDLGEIARMWDFAEGGVTPQAARNALAYMTENHARNDSGTFFHTSEKMRAC